MTKNKIVITGGLGLVGKELIRIFSKGNFEIIVIDLRGQLNRNSSNDLRGDLEPPYDPNYTPFHQTAIYGEAANPGNRL